MTTLNYHGSPTNSDGQESVNHYHHRKALDGNGNDFARAMIAMLTGWEQYADAHRERYDQPVGWDFAIGTWWGEAGLAIKRLLDGEVGGLDCGSLSHNILAKMEAEGLKEGVDHDGYYMTREDE